MSKKIVYIKVRKDELERLKKVSYETEDSLRWFKGRHDEMKQEIKDLQATVQKLEHGETVALQEVRKANKTLAMILAGAVCKENPFTKEEIHRSFDPLNPYLPR